MPLEEIEIKYGSYRSYVKSPEWAERRQRRIEFDGGFCQTCGSTVNLQVHHRNYDHAGTEEEFADLITRTNTPAGKLRLQG